MRLSNKPNIVTGSILLLGAAFFSIALALLPMDFGAYGPGSSSSLYTTAYNIGEILFSVYGFSSILIPVFLFIAGISCFASRWTARKSMRLLTAVVPFFTSVIIEKICRAMLEYPDDFTSIKIALTVSIGAFLVAIEILTAGLIADRVNVFAKATYDKIGSSAVAASGLIPGTEITRLGAGVEYYPLGGRGNRDVRVHAAYAYNIGTNTNEFGTALGDGSFLTVGVTWKVDVIKGITSLIDKRNAKRAEKM